MWQSGRQPRILRLRQYSTCDDAQRRNDAAAADDDDDDDDDDDMMMLIMTTTLWQCTCLAATLIHLLIHTSHNDIIYAVASDFNFHSVIIFFIASFVNISCLCISVYSYMCTYVCIYTFHLHTTRTDFMYICAQNITHTQTLINTRLFLRLFDYIFVCVPCTAFICKGFLWLLTTARASAFIISHKL